MACILKTGVSCADIFIRVGWNLVTWAIDHPQNALSSLTIFNPDTLIMRTKLFLLSVTLWLLAESVATTPPSIYIQPKEEVFFKQLEPIELPCVAEGEQPITYTWKRNGIDFNPYDSRIVQSENNGTIFFNKPDDRDEGIYQCFAENRLFGRYGKSASIKTELKEAKLRTYDFKEPIYHNPIFGGALTLSCTPPESRPPVEISWAKKDEEGHSTWIDSDSRITMDYDGRLRFTNVDIHDSEDGMSYVCMAFNEVLGMILPGPPHFISVRGNTAELRATSYLWASPREHFGLRKDKFKIKCIFAGNPTPTVSWTRPDGRPLPGTSTNSSLGQELVFESLEYSDAGTYRCSGDNGLGPPAVTRDITIRVESRPYWEEEPQNVVLSIGETANFRCHAGGIPEPNVTWFVNAVPLLEVTDPRINGRFQVNNTEIVFMQVTLEDSMVIQCNASNKHGYIWGDVYIHVIPKIPETTQTTTSVSMVTETESIARVNTTEATTATTPPSIYIQPEQEVVFKSGEPINLPCVAEGEQPITYTWKRNGIDFNPFDSRIVQSENNGTIFFNKTEDKDEGIYQCFAENRYGKSASIKTELKEAKLKDFHPVDPRNHYPVFGAHLTLICSYTESTPPAEVYLVKRDQHGNFTSVITDSRVTMDYEERLRFTNIHVNDTEDGMSYVCMARNGVLDKVVEGDEHFINVQGSVEEMRGVSYLWASPTEVLGLREDKFKIKCIFAGNPTPTVSWTRPDGRPLPGTSTNSSLGQELVFESLEYSDAGTYRCSGDNGLGPSAVTRDMTIRVESRPYWEEEPQNVVVSIGETANFRCHAGGVPEPNVTWFVNSVPLSEVTDPRIDGRFQVNNTEIVFMQVTREDSMVIQCNASNKHGYIWGDVYIHVIREIPETTQTTASVTSPPMTTETDSHDGTNTATVIPETEVTSTVWTGQSTTPMGNATELTSFLTTTEIQYPYPSSGTENVLCPTCFIVMTALLSLINK